MQLAQTPQPNQQACSMILRNCSGTARIIAFRLYVSLNLPLSILTEHTLDLLLTLSIGLSFIMFPTLSRSGIRIIYKYWFLFEV